MDSSKSKQRRKSSSASSDDRKPVSFFARFANQVQSSVAATANQPTQTSSFKIHRKETKPFASNGSAMPPPNFAGTFLAGVSEDPNLKIRSTMEDAHCIIYDFPSASFTSSTSPATTTTSTSSSTSFLSRSRSRSESNPPAPSLLGTAIGSNVSGHISADAGFFAIFDGHAGKAAAEWCGQKLHSVLEDQLKRDPHGQVPELLDRTFTESDVLLSKQPVRNSGCTAVVALLRWEDRLLRPKEGSDGSQQQQEPPQRPYHHNHFLHHHSSPAPSSSQTQTQSQPKTVRERMLYTANAGDARIVLARNGRALRLSYDHKGTDPDEAQRVVNSGGVVLNGRVNGILAVTRSLGDLYIKNLVTSHPYTTETYLTAEDEFMILACDGLWDVCSDQEAVDVVRPIADPQEASRALVSFALEHFSMDNLTVIVVRFDSRMSDVIRSNHTKSSSSSSSTTTKKPPPTQQQTTTIEEETEGEAETADVSARVEALAVS
ncbi:phosphatase 2C-like domain-containing protein [Myxozyma melibiosi]|uniref:Phosphatase 2C-like domain-containing protein n=1 Tax=Myxozyma melibiosi TaxID=54550 RepID=A0ABR1F616_9ASCO